MIASLFLGIRKYIKKFKGRTQMLAKKHVCCYILRFKDMDNTG